MGNDGLIEDTRGHWGNFATGEYDYRETPETDDECVQYIPQYPAAQSLYKLYRQDWEKGNLSPLDAMTKVLMAVVGEHE